MCSIARDKIQAIAAGSAGSMLGGQSPTGSAVTNGARRVASGAARTMLGGGSSTGGAPSVGGGFNRNKPGMSDQP